MLTLKAIQTVKQKMKNMILSISKLSEEDRDGLGFNSIAAKFISIKSKKEKSPNRVTRKTSRINGRRGMKNATAAIKCFH